ncbi:MAG: phage tail sheath subtilisin-like domain-containing protein [Pseudomonadota bacterium]
MPDTFLHGVEVVDIATGSRPIRTTRSSVIGLIGTAPAADAEAFPLDTPVLISRRIDAANLGTAGTLPDAIDGIFDQIGAMVVMVRVAEGATDAETLSNLIGGIDEDTGAPVGVHTFLGAHSVVKVSPKILIAPGFSQSAPLVEEMKPIATRLRAIIIADGPNSTSADAVTYKEAIAHKRVYLIDPHIKVWDTTEDKEVLRPASAHIAGVWAKSDEERGWWHSPSNRLINGVLGTARPIDFGWGDVNSTTNFLNGRWVSTIVQRDGYRAYGNRATDGSFVKDTRIHDMIAEAIQRSHFWAVDRNADRQYFENVIGGVNTFGRSLINRGVVAGFECWADPDLNTPEALADGWVYFNYDYAATPTAERITFRAMINSGYLTNVLPVAA